MTALARRPVAAVRRDLAPVAALGAVLVAGVPASAAGADDPGGVALSVDGRRWSSELATPLFDATAWVPGETRRSVLLVRNDGPGPAHGAVAVAVEHGEGDAADAALADALDVRVRAADAPWSAAEGPVPVRVAESEVLPVALEVTLAATAGDEVEGATAPLDVVVTLAGEGEGEGEDERAAALAGARPLAEGGLARTGGAAVVVLLAAAGAVAAGAALRAVGRRGGPGRG
ncbi:hypothetical protein ACH436_03275 [Isoptericola sp. NPDC019693]|uniref:hypothetical protein n=1 Tax=Isoptericola sp. NPDC019693 TaxID=3364009 RepID=UPI00379A3E32